MLKQGQQQSGENATSCSDRYWFGYSLRMWTWKDGVSKTVFQSLVAGKNGVRELAAEMIPAGCNVKVAGRVPRGTEPGDFDESEYKAMDREVSLFIKYAMKAADFALRDSGLASAIGTATTSEVEGFPYQRDRCGVSIGNGGIGSLFEICGTHDTLKTSIRKVSPYFVPKILVNMASGHVSIRHGFAGPVHCVTTACAAGSHSIGDAYNLIRLGYADLMLAGGSDASIEPLALAGFSRMKALSTPITDKSMESSSRPFDKHRNGFVMGEGAGVLVLEDFDAAIARKAPIIAEICGYGLSGDAHHATSPPDNGDGAFRSMTSALRDARLPPSAIGYVNAHATSTPLGDQAELCAIRRVLVGESTQPVYVSSTKGATGHLLGAAGAVESAFTALAVQSGILPPTLHVDELDPALQTSLAPSETSRCPLTVITNQAQTAPSIQYAMKNSFGFGGTNASLIFGKYPASTSSVSQT